MPQIFYNNQSLLITVLINIKILLRVSSLNDNTKTSYKEWDLDPCFCTQPETYLLFIILMAVNWRYSTWQSDVIAAWHYTKWTMQ